MGAHLLMAAWVGAMYFGATIPAGDVQQQSEIFERFWGTDLVWKFEELPDQGGVGEDRVPYSGCIYLDQYGGTASALRKYDRAFHGGRMLATAHEQWDTTAFQVPVRSRSGLFGRRQVTRMATPHWHGHCNGWAAAAIRHAEPRNNVTRNGVVFSPADIKALLAELYIYNDLADLSGSSANIQAGLFHAVVANWLGRGSHPLGMEADPGREKWNYPAYLFRSTAERRSAQQVDIRLDLTYARESQGEFQRSPRIARIKSFHYRLDLNEQGEIVGGEYYRDSARIDMLWVPLRPKPPGQAGHERGNPHIRVETILAIWRDSVPEETRRQWLVVDPADEDRVTEIAAVNSLIPLQDRESARAESPAGKTPADPATASAAAATPADAPAGSDETPDADSASRAGGGEAAESPPTD